MRALCAAALALVLALFLGQTAPSSAPRTRPAPEPAPKPDLENVKYGPHERNVLDLWQAKSDKPTPLIVYIHGGGFVGGDKRSVNRALLRQALASGISFAAINYRYSTQAPAPAPFADSARAIQFIRSNARKWNIDPTRIAATGGSAGAGISLWLAFHDDMADPKNEDPVLRESTRLKCAFVLGAQISYDPRWIKENVPGNGWKHTALPTLFGMKPDEVENPPADKAKLMAEFAPITHLNAGDPPVYMDYGQDRSVPENKDPGATIHHPKFGDILKEKMDALKIECVVHVKGEPATKETPFEFLQRHLKAAK